MAIQPEYKAQGGETEALIYSTAALLLAGAVFSTAQGAAAGDWMTRGSIRELLVTARAHQASAAMGFVVEESMLGTEAIGTAGMKVTQLTDQDGATTIGVDKYVSSVVTLTFPYYRVKYTNGAADQTVFNLAVKARR